MLPLLKDNGEGPAFREYAEDLMTMRVLKISQILLRHHCLIMALVPAYQRYDLNIRLAISHINTE